MPDEAANKLVLPRAKRQILNKNTNKSITAHVVNAENEKKKAR